MTSEDKFIGIYEDKMEIINKAEQLIADGWKEKDIYLLTRDRGDLAVLRYKKLLNVRQADGSWEDYFVGFFSGEAHVKKAMSLQGFPETGLAKYFDVIENGGRVLYADHGELDHYYKENSEFKHAAPATVIEGGTGGPIDATPGAGDLDNQGYPTKGDHRVALDGQNIRREGDQVVDPTAEVGFSPNYYEIGQDR